MEYRKLEEIKTTILEYGEYLMSKGCNYLLESSFQLAIASLFYIAICLICYFTLRSNTLKNFKSVLVVIAHPDDECMFFGPVILNFTQRKECRVYLLCLSSGNHDGLGSKRKQELWDSCKRLGIRSSDIILYQSTILPDNPEIRWATDRVAEIILNHSEALEIDLIVTFDKDGVSGHLNHSSLYYAAAYLFIENKLPPGLEVYCLESTNILRKYWSLLDVPISRLLSNNRSILTWNESKIVQNAMYEHKSQMVWFRRLYLIFSRYMLVNTLQRMDKESLELDLTLDE